MATMRAGAGGTSRGGALAAETDASEDVDVGRDPAAGGGGSDGFERSHAAQSATTSAARRCLVTARD
jgi:hypothetical protein